jgi:hypothetical protein
VPKSVEWNDFYRIAPGLKNLLRKEPPLVQIKKHSGASKAEKTVTSKLYIF